MNGMELNIGNGISPCFFVFQEVEYVCQAITKSLLEFVLYRYAREVTRLLEIEITRDY